MAPVKTYEFEVTCMDTSSGFHAVKKVEQLIEVGDEEMIEKLHRCQEDLNAND